jgi:hypothetical protein
MRGAAPLSQTREAPFVVMGFQLGTFDKGATRFDDTANVKRLIQQFAGRLNGGIS